TSPITARAVIVLPDPDSPTSATRSAPTPKEMPLTASKSPVSTGKATTRSATSRIGSAMAGGKQITEPVGEQVEGETGDEDRHARGRGDPPLVEDYRRAVGDHGTPLRGRRAHAEAEEAEPRGGQNHAGKVESQPDDRRRERHRQDMAEEEARSAD